jgi:oligopeptide transport system permease protein
MTTGERQLRGDGGRAPWRLVFARLLRHRLAVAGFALLLLVVAFVLAGPLLVATTASETRLWIGSQPPGHSHPDCRQRVFLELGKPPPEGSVAGRHETVRYRLRQKVRRELRIALRRGRVRSITEGALSMPRVDLAAVDGTPREVGADNLPGRAVPGCVVEVGQPPAAGLFAEGQRVLFVAWERTVGERTVEITTQGGRIAAIVERDAAGARELPSATIEGGDVVQVTGDGRELRLMHPFGTDELGRDLFLRVVAGGRVSLLVGLVASLVSLVVGVAYGAVAGLAGGRLDALMMRLVDILYGLPFIFLVLLLMVVFDRNIILLFAALGLVQWLTMARIVRGQVLGLKGQEFVEAARMCGGSNLKIIVFHLLPHLLGPIVVYTTLTIPIVILEESFLAFIGLPVQFQGTTLDSWGSLVHIGMSSLGEGGQNWWLLVFPSLAMVVTLFGLNSFGDGLRDSLDPKGRSEADGDAATRHAVSGRTRLVRNLQRICRQRAGG